MKCSPFRKLVCCDGVFQDNLHCIERNFVVVQLSVLVMCFRSLFLLFFLFLQLHKQEFDEGLGN